jgi:hypothetical protein
MKDFDPLALQIHEVDMELDDTAFAAGADAVLAVHHGLAQNFRAGVPARAGGAFQTVQVRADLNRP